MKETTGTNYALIFGRADRSLELLYKDLKRYPSLPKDVVKTYVDQVLQGDTTNLNKLINSQLRLSFHISLKKYGTFRGVEDLVSEAFKATIIAVNNIVENETFKAKEKNVANFVDDYIRAYLNKYLRSVIQKVHIGDPNWYRYKYLLRRQEYYRQIFEHPISVEDVMYLEDYKLNNNLLSLLDISSIEDQLAPDVELTFEDTLKDIDPNMDLIMSGYKESKLTLIALFKKILSKPEFTVISKSFGLIDNYPMDLSEIATEMGLSYRTVSRFHSDAARKLNCDLVKNCLKNIVNTSENFIYFKEAEREFEKLFKKAVIETYKKRENGKELTPEETDIILKNYGKVKHKELLEFINSSRPEGKKISRDTLTSYLKKLDVEINRGYSDKIEHFLRANYMECEIKELAERVNKEFGTDYNTSQLKHKLQRMGCRKNENWNETSERILLENYLLISSSKLADLLNKTYKGSFNTAQVKAKLKRMGLKKL